MVASAVGRVLVLAALAATVLGNAVLLTAQDEDLYVCTSDYESGSIATPTARADVGVGLGSYAAAALAASAIIVLGIALQRGVAGRRSWAWVALAFFVFVPAAFAFLVSAIAAFGECSSGFF